MKRNFTNENFEDFLRQSADGLRMRPSGNVWKGISKHLNKRRRRIGFAIGTFFFSIATLGYFIVQNSNKLGLAVDAGSAHTPAVKITEKQAKGRNVQQPPASSPVVNAQAFLKDNFTATINKTSPIAQLPIAVTDGAGGTDSGQPGSSSTAFSPTIVDSYFDHFAEETTPKQNTARPSLYPMTIESVINSYKAKSQKKKLGFQFYFTPTISYRKLGENKSFLRSQSVSNPNYLPALIFDVNNVVTHKPDIGFELGMAAKYPITRKMKLRGGLQFNVNRYDIKAYNAATSVATILFICFIFIRSYSLKEFGL